ncbi:MAG: NUDIX domain-containing protein [Desulfobacterales bacterium]|nr:NUDIX domain-containing protein [Desulfobacterales bacterium]
MRKKCFCHFCGHPLTEKTVNGQTRLYCENCDTPIYENPVPATCLVTIDNSERVLLVKRSVAPKKGWWCLPGGFMELRETPEAAGLRELFEETGLSGRIDRLLGVTTNNSTYYDTVLMVGFLVKSWSGRPVAGDDADAAQWFEYAALPDIAFESHQRFIARYYTVYANTHPSNS